MPLLREQLPWYKVADLKFPDLAEAMPLAIVVRTMFKAITVDAVYAQRRTPWIQFRSFNRLGDAL